MKIVRLQIPGNFLKHVGFAQLFEELEFVEILNAFQYDQRHFFSLQRIRFKIDIGENIDTYIEQLQAEKFQLLEHRGKEIICILDQTRSSGFFPIVDSGPWAFLFPIQISNQVLLINIISHADYVETLFKILSRLSDDYEIIGMTDLNDIKDNKENYWHSLVPFPKFTQKQEEIVSFAAKQGYFKSPKKISGKVIGEHFGITESAVNKHLRNASNTSMEYFFGKY